MVHSRPLPFLSVIPEGNLLFRTAVRLHTYGRFALGPNDVILHIEDPILCVIKDAGISESRLSSTSES